MQVTTRAQLTAIGEAIAQRVIDETKLTPEQKALVEKGNSYVSVGRDTATGVCLVDPGNRVGGDVVAKAFIDAVQAQGGTAIAATNLRQVLVAKSPQEIFTDGYKRYNAEVESKVYAIIDRKTIESIEYGATLEAKVEAGVLADAIKAELAKRVVVDRWVERNLEGFMSPQLLDDEKFNAFVSKEYGSNVNDAAPQLARMLVDAAQSTGESLTEQFFMTFVGKLSSGQTLKKAALGVLRTSGVVGDEALITYLTEPNRDLALEALKNDAVFTKLAKPLLDASDVTMDSLEHVLRKGGSPSIALMHVLGAGIRSSQE